MFTTGIFDACDAFYYVREIDNELFWFAQDTAANWAHVFHGRIMRNAGRSFVATNPGCPGVQFPGREDIATGLVVDVPKGMSCSAGEISLSSISLLDNTCEHILQNHVLTQTTRPREPSRFWGPQTGDRAEARTAVDARLLPPGWQGRGTADLSGLWIDEEGVHHYLHERRGAGSLAWFSEDAGALPQVFSPRQPGVGRTSVFVGRRADRRIAGRWADVPKGARQRHGTLAATIENSFTIRIERDEGRYASRTLQRITAAALEILLHDLRVLHADDAGGADPKLHVAFCKIDGQTVDLSRIGESRASLAAFDTGRLATDVPAGRPPVPLSGLPSSSFATVLRTIPGASPEAETTPASFVGVNVGGWDEDESPSDERRRAFSTWRDDLRNALDQDVRRARTPDFLELAGRRTFRFGWGNRDDHFADSGRTWEFRQIDAMRGSSENFQIQISNRDHGDYLVRGEISVDRRGAGRCRQGAEQVVIFYEAATRRGELWRLSADGSVFEFIDGSDIWRNSWSSILTGRFGGSANADLLFYDRGLGEGEFYTVEDSGALARLGPLHEDWRTTWRLIVSGRFGGSCEDDLLFYDASLADAETYSTDNGGFERIRRFPGWRRTWDIITPVDLANATNFDGLLFHDREARATELYGLDETGESRIAGHLLPGRRWDIVVAGRFGDANLLFYSREEGLGLFARANDDGLEEVITNTGWRNSWAAIVSLSFPGNDSPAIFFYDGENGSVEWYAVGTGLVLPSRQGRTGLRRGWNTVAAGSWDAPA